MKREYYEVQVRTLNEEMDNLSEKDISEYQDYVQNFYSREGISLTVLRSTYLSLVSKKPYLP